MTFFLLYWKQLLAAGLVLGALSFTYWLGGQSGRTDLAEYKAKVAKQATHVADLATKSSELARKTEQAHGAALAQVAEQYEQDKQNAQAASDRLAADLRSGNRKLHQRWQAALATSELPSAAKSASELDAEARDREGSAIRIVRAADQCDAQVEGLQRVIRADRGN